MAEEARAEPDTESNPIKGILKNKKRDNVEEAEPNPIKSILKKGRKSGDKEPDAPLPPSPTKSILKRKSENEEKSSHDKKSKRHNRSPTRRSRNERDEMPKIKKEPESPRSQPTKNADSRHPSAVKKESEAINLTQYDDEDDDEYAPVQDPKVDRSRICPYLDTINRSVLDFDFEKLCSVSLSHINVYACMVCGKYFQGRGKMSHAYTHSVQEGHHVYLNLQTQKFYCLPDNYQIIDSSLEDIIYVLNPTFTTEAISVLDTNSKLSRAYDGTTYLPGVVGLNNIKENDYCNVILQAFAHVSPLRNYFLQEESYKKIKRPPGDIMITLVQRFGEFLRKLWNPRNFKAHVSPHEMLQAVVLCSKKKFQITEQGDALEFMSWILNALHLALNGSRKLSSSIINKTFRGKMRVYTRKVLPIDLKDEEKAKLLETGEYMETMDEIPWLYLTCDLPPSPLYPDELRENIIPQVPFATLLSKFNGVSEKEYKTHRDSHLKRFVITHLPQYIIIFIKRFTKNYFIKEKNNTIVNFPIKNIDFGDLLPPEERVKHKCTTYDLMANVVHDGLPERGKGTYRCHVLHKGTQKWFELQDLHVTEILPQMIPLSESYIQIFELRKDIPNPMYGKDPKDVVSQDMYMDTQDR
ncbi:hypothetical protein FSP39_006198 [Pinctada imbricata]|uniref:Ubiquitin carboxyl-terminal hydrolase 39 n=1 Tax=Pinctada imbricata TaxID=66713 RepID=A0AA88XSQ0_PINIB|nr:hypothetical protein FSP39_006198 [Pinctada imbricata]